MPCLLSSASKDANADVLYDTFDGFVHHRFILERPIVDRKKDSKDAASPTSLLEGMTCSVDAHFSNMLRVIVG